MKEKYAGKLNLLCGVELGQILHDIEAAKLVNADSRVDFIIGSVHQVMGEQDFYFIDYEKLTMDDIYDLLERYFRDDLDDDRLYYIYENIPYITPYSFTFEEIR